MARERKYYFDYLRIICAFGVVVGHVCCNEYVYMDVNSTSWKIIAAYLNVAPCVVLVFFMISGALFLDKDKPLDMKDLFKKIFRMLTVFFFWSVLYALSGNIASISDFIDSVITGHYHMWFIPAQIGCYLTLPFLKKIVESETLTKYFLVMGVVFMCVSNNLLPQLELIPVKPIAFAAEQLNSLLSSFVFKAATGYAYFFVVGYYLEKKALTKKAQISLIAVGVLAYLISAGLSIGISVAQGEAYQGLLKKSSVNVLLIAVGVFVFGKSVLSKISLKGKAIPVVREISKCTFGIYLIHVFVIDFLRDYLNLSASSFNPIISVPLTVLLVFAISLLVSAILNKIPFVNKYFI